MSRFSAFLVTAALSTAACSQPPPTADTGSPATPVPDGLLTVAERSDFRSAARHDDVVKLLDALAASSPLARRFDMGKTEEGREIPVLSIADSAVATPEDAAKQKGKLVVLLLGNIHAGEVDGKEGLPILAREILTTKDHPLLKDLIILVAPIYNADGNEKIGELARQRPGQVGPEVGGVGQRENAKGLDLNRDFVKLEAAETRALVKFMNAWDPAIVIDTHTTNGSHHQYLVTYAGPKVPAGNAGLIKYVRETMMPDISKTLLEKPGMKTFWYGNFEENHTKWDTFPAEARYGTSYVGLRNRIGILSEGYSYATYKDRVLGTRDFVRACLEYAAANKDRVRKVIADADSAAVAAGKKPKDTDLIALRTKAVAAEGKVSVLGFEEEQKDGHAVSTGRGKDYEVELIDRFEATRSVKRPYAYLFPPSFGAVVETLQRHGVEVEELREDIELDVEVYRVDAVTRAVRPFQGHSTVVVDATPRVESRRYEAGTVVVRTGQKLGSLASYLLEPECEDGLTTWNYFDGSLGEGTPDFPVARVVTPQPMTTGKVRPLADGRPNDKPITFEAVYESEKPPPPNFGGSPVGIGAWLEDGETFLQVKENRLYKVAAATGRATPFHDPEKMAKALGELPTIGAKTANQIAERAGFQMNKDRTAALIEHENDLYYCRFDGEGGAVRLTSTPQHEELASFSPDGKFVAFVRDNDLYVVDVATRHERALTSGGTDLLRNGKNDWVHFEEIFNRNWRAYWWSPDSGRLAFLQIDSSPVKTYSIISDLPEPQNLEQTPYPKPGKANPKARLGIVPVAGGDVHWMDASGYDEGGHLFVGVGWWPDSSAAWCYIQDRVQTWMDLCSVPSGGGKPTRLFREKTEAWVDPPDGPRFLKDGSFFFLSERSGYKHLYHYDKGGKPIGAEADGKAKPITDGEWEVHGIVHLDGDAEEELNAKGAKSAKDSKEDKGKSQEKWIWFTGTKDGWTTMNVYRAHLDGTGLERVTTEPGSHSVSVSPTGKYFVDTWSSTTAPTKVVLRAIEVGAAPTSMSVVRTLDTNPVYAIEEYRFGNFEQVQIPIGEGRTLEGTIVYPPDFDPTKKYPVWFMTYAGPHTPTISGSWSGGRVFDQVLASAGIVAFHADPWTASGKGASSTWPSYKQLGVKEMEDIKSIIKWLVDEHPWADPTRIGMSGHSYGGFMTSYALTHCDLFAAGIAGAPVTDWRDYDSIYTERFMLTPQENPEGYEKTSVVAAAKNLHGRLLLIHGGIDDNVHVQNTTRLIKALQDAGKPFEFMIYPTSRHGVGGKHYQRLMYDFIMRTMRPEGSEAGGGRKPEANEEPETGR